MTFWEYANNHSGDFVLIIIFAIYGIVKIVEAIRKPTDKLDD